MRKNQSVALVAKASETYRDDPKKLIRELKKLVREGKRSGDYVLMGAAYCRLAAVCQDADDPSGILSNSLKAVALLKNSDEYELLARAYTNLAQAFTLQENNRMALVSDEIAYELVQKHRIKGFTKINILNNLSASYHQMGEHKKSIQYLTKCIALLKGRPDRDDADLAMFSLNLAEFLKDRGDTEAAGEVLRSMSPWIDQVWFQPIVCDYYLRCAIFALSEGDPATGLRHTDTAFALLPANSYPLPIYDDLRDLAHLLAVQGDRPRAEIIFGLMNTYAEKNPGTVEQLFATRMIADFHRQFGEYRQAAEAYARYEALTERHKEELQEIQLKMLKTTKNTELEIRRLKQQMRKKEELMSLEPMTKLLNRSALLRVSADFIDCAARKKQKVGAIFLDIDFFKECNDTYGHAKGDEIIQEVANACRKQETANVRFARYGGDEFFGITQGLTDEALLDVARRICQTIRNADLPNAKNPNGGRITLSVGVVNLPITDNSVTILEIVNYADKALYYAKSAGKNTIYQLDRGESDVKEANASYIKIEF